MEKYINDFNLLKKKVIYDFKLGDGGIGDCIKFFMGCLNFCIDNQIKLYYKVNNINIEKYLKLKYTQMYITDDEIKILHKINNNLDFENISENDDEYYYLTPFFFYNNPLFNYENYFIQNIFEFSEEIKLNKNKLLSCDVDNYISIHLRLGDKYLETDKSFVLCKNDTRYFNETNLFEFIEQNQNKYIIFFCDNNNYKLNLKKKYDFINILHSDIGHTSLSNTDDNKVLDTITELYIMSNSEKIICASKSGFSIVASKFKNIPLINI